MHTLPPPLPGEIVSTDEVLPVVETPSIPKGVQVLVGLALVGSLISAAADRVSSADSSADVIEITEPFEVLPPETTLPGRVVDVEVEVPLTDVVDIDDVVVAPSTTVAPATTTTVPATTTTTVAPSTTEALRELTLTEQYFATELPTYELGEHMGVVVVGDKILTTLTQGPDGFSVEPKFTDYADEGAVMWGGLEPTKAMTSAVGCHRTTYGAPCGAIDQITTGDELQLIFQKETSEGIEEVATFTYEADLDTPHLITPSDTDVVIGQREVPSINVFSCNTTQARFAAPFTLTDIEYTGFVFSES